VIASLFIIYTSREKKGRDSIKNPSLGSTD